MASCRSVALDVARLIAELASAGLDIAHVFDAHAIGELAARSTGPLTVWSRLTHGPRAGLLVGNTRALWPRFLAARDSLPEINPLDTYVEREVARAIEAARVHARVPDALAGDAGDLPAAVFSHRRYDGAFLPFQQIAIATGLGALSVAGLVVHPVYGPWFALRALLSFESSPMPALTPIAKPCECTGACQQAFDRAMASTSDWRAWVAVRDACSINAYRYSDEQIAFHYTHAWPTVGRDKRE